MYVHKVLVNPLVKLAQEKVWLGELNRLYMTIAFDLDVKNGIKQNNIFIDTYLGNPHSF